MDFVTIEGADGTGKSTVHRGFYKETSGPEAAGSSREYDRVPGIVDRLSQALSRPVRPSREPGTLPQEGDWWDPPGMLDIEDHLNKTLQWMGVAWTLVGPQHEHIRRVLEAAGFYHQHETLLTDACRSGGGWPGTFLSERRSMKARWLQLATLAGSDPTIRRRLQTYDARDAIRHALIGAADSDWLNPTTSGLLFFAGHLLHARWLDTLGEDTLVISDRAGESNLAYGRARGDAPEVEELYRTERPIEPDLVFVLICEQSEIGRRLGIREKRENKSWDGIHTIMDAQRAYRQLAEELNCPFEFLDTTSMSSSAAIDAACGTLQGLFAKPEAAGVAT
jgi:thymidylate kinase